MNKNTNIIDTISTKQMIGLMLLAYVFSFAIRMIWVYQFQGNPSFMWDGELMINTNDGYFFATAVEYLLSGVHVDNPRVNIAIESYPGMVYTTYFLTRFTPFSLDTVILYLPAIISSLVVIPIILTGKLIRLPWVGFFAAILGSIVWSYYNRTMVGYYDTDMFSVFLQFTILYLFLFTIYSKEDKNILWLGFALILYPFFYPQGLSLIYAIFIFWTLYQLLLQGEEKNSYFFIIMASVALWTIPIWIKALLLVVLFIFLKKLKYKLDNQRFFYLTLTALIIFFFFGNVFELILAKTSVYLDRGVKDTGLHFYQVIQTVREAGKISWETVSNRIIGHPILFLLSLIGYILLLIKHKPFILALPLIGVGIFAHWAGLRFTVYAVPVASFSLIYLFYFISQYVKDKKISYAILVGLSLLALYPNISHIIGYKVPTVLNKTEVQDLEKLNEIADAKDYTLAWWDYGYPLWYYSDTSTLIDGAKHHNDNFVISKIMQTTSADLAVNLSRLAVETYAKATDSYSSYLEDGENEESIPPKFKMQDKDAEIYHAGKGAIIDVLLRNGQEDQMDPDLFLEELKSNAYILPPKTRDIYLYLPYRMMRIFPTVAVFGNLDLSTGEAIRKISFYPTSVASNKNGVIIFKNGIKFDAKKGNITIGNNLKSVKNFIVTQNTKQGKVNLQSQLYHADGEYAVVYMKNYGQFVVMDVETFNSTYVQMFMLEKYDKNLFELVVSSAYSKIYKLKK